MFLLFLQRGNLAPLLSRAIGSVTKLSRVRCHLSLLIDDLSEALSQRGPVVAKRAARQSRSRWRPMALACRTCASSAKACR